MHNFEIKQVALEHLSSVKITPISIEVIDPTVPDPPVPDPPVPEPPAPDPPVSALDSEPELAPMPVTVSDEFVAGNRAPFYELPPAPTVALNRTAEVSSWSLSLP